MTKRQRAQVVELLRCAADLHVGDSDTGLAHATDALEADHLWKLALEARVAARSDGPTEYLHTCLEAAARVEEGSYP